jgi:hypothetical protein
VGDECCGVTRCEAEIRLQLRLSCHMHVGRRGRCATWRVGLRLCIVGLARSLQHSLFNLGPAPRWSPETSFPIHTVAFNLRGTI